MRNLMICCFFLCLSLGAQGQMLSKKMQFNDKGEFKIAQFTDMHLNTDARKNEIVLTMIQEVLDLNHPDLVVFTGDNTTMDDVQGGWDEVAKLLASHQIPWTAVLGNHDDESAVKRAAIIDVIRKEPYCIMPATQQKIKGEGNHVVPIYGAASGKQPKALLYCFDSNSYSTVSTVKGYGWIGLSQINWYKKVSATYTKKNDGKPLPALAFFHIPLPEYREAWESLATRRFGERNEKECSAEINSGLFTSFLECGDVMGTFVGHDHINDYIALFHGIALGYGRGSGGHNTYGDAVPGGRIIVLKEGKRSFDTWVNEKGNKKRLDFCTYPTSFLQKK